MCKVFCLVVLTIVSIAAAGDFEKIALVDSFDFATFCDPETRTGNAAIIDHVLGTLLPRTRQSGASQGHSHRAVGQGVCRRIAQGQRRHSPLGGGETQDLPLVGVAEDCGKRVRSVAAGG